MISEGESTAQVDPRRLCEFLLEGCKERGVVLHQPAKAIRLGTDMRENLASVRVELRDTEVVDCEFLTWMIIYLLICTVPCSRLVITAGAWSPRVFSTLFPQSTTKLPISSLAGHSLVIRSPRWRSEDEVKGCHAVFATDTDGFSPEIFSRIGREIYVAGLNDASLPLPEVASESKPDPEAVDRLKKVAKHMLGVPGAEDDLEIVREGLCFRPVTRAHPIVGRIPDKLLGSVDTRGGGYGGVFIAAGKYERTSPGKCLANTIFVF